MKKKILQSITVLTIILVGGFWGVQKTHSFTTGIMDITAKDSPDPFNPKAGEKNTITVDNVGNISCGKVTLEIENVGKNWEWNELAPTNNVKAVWDGKDDGNHTVSAGTYTYVATCYPVEITSLKNGILDLIIPRAFAYFTDTETGEITVEDNNSPRKPQIFGLFIGIKDYLLGLPIYRADIGADEVAAKFRNITSNVVSLPLDAKNDNNKNIILHKIIEMESRMQPGDTFVLYIHSHGGTYRPENNGPESTVNKGNEYVSTTKKSEGIISDDELQVYLHDDGLVGNRMKDINKWVIIDSCHSGGFWGDKSLSDYGDLEKLSNASLLAASGEDKNTEFKGLNDYGFFTYGLLFALSEKKDKILNADLNENGVLSFGELYKYMDERWPLTVGFRNYIGKIMYEADFGDEVLFSQDMWKPVGYKTDDFLGEIDTTILPDPDIHPEIYPIADGNGPYEDSQGKSINFDASKSYDSDGSIVNYEWDWDNDGNYDESSFSPAAEHTWDSPLSKSIVGLQVTDNDGLSSTDKILVNISSKTICSSMEKNKGLDIFDTFKLNSEENERVTVKLRPNEDGEYTNGEVAITLWPGLNQFKKEKGTLPVELDATLPKSGWHDISVFRHGKNGFNGDYCITVESSGDAWKTLEATKNVE